MRTWTGQHASAEWSGRLSVTQGDGFELAVLPLLRVLWPGLRQAPRLQAWDQRGIDLFVWADSGPFPCAIQCKGFKVQELGPRQIRDIERSMRKFLRSDATAGTYLIVHNRDGRNRELARRVNVLLEHIVRSGKARQAYLWDRQEVVRRAFGGMEAVLERALQSRSRGLAEHFAGLFRFAGCHVDDVPVSERTLTFRRGMAADLGDLQGPILRNPTALLEEASGTKWIMLSGQFGVGKTTAALAAATGSRRPTVFVPCQAVAADVFTAGSTNGLAKHIVNSLSLLDEVNEQDRLPLTGMASAVFSYLLRKPNSPFLFVLDGLDEHHVLATLSGLQRLSNQLAEFSCPVVLTTRREHLDSMLGDFNTAFSELGSKFAKVRQATVFYLDQWTQREVTAVVQRAALVIDDEERDRFKALAAAVDTGTQPYGDLIFHPLFLQFILEDVAEGRVAPANRARLIQNWVERKIRRDRETWVPNAAAERVQVRAHMDTDEFVERICTAMAGIATEMSLERDGQRQLAEGLAADRIVAIVREEMGGGDVNLLPVLLNSVLTTLGPRRGARIQVGFALRVLHEYFAAVDLVSRRAPLDGWPATVRSLANEIATAADHSVKPRHNPRNAPSRPSRAGTRRRRTVPKTVPTPRGK